MNALTHRAEMIHKMKLAVGKVLKQSPAAYAFASRMLYRVDRSFRTLSPGTPEAITSAWKTASELQGPRLGDYYEFGVFRGYALWQAERTCREQGLDHVHLWGFDSFQGLPTVSGTDADDGIFFEGQFACSRRDVERYLREHGTNMDTVTLIEGFFNETLTEELKTQHRMRPVGVALIDCDLYSSTVDVLSWLGTLIQDGSVLLFDDWKSFGSADDRGQPRAFREFLETSPWKAKDYRDFGADGRGFVMSRSEGDAVSARAAIA